MTNSQTYGQKVVAVIKGEGLLSGCIIINPAEEVGELRTKPVQSQTAALSASASSGSAADELLKLKQLLDNKLITPTEFTAQKNRIFKQQGSEGANKSSAMAGKTQTETILISSL